MLDKNEFYHLYKPLRNITKKYGIEHSIRLVWLYSQHIMNGKDLPMHLQFYVNNKYCNLREYIPPWELMIALKEIVLNSDGSATKSLDKFADLACILNAIKKVDNDIVKQSLSVESVLAGLHKSAHLQFPWQKLNSANVIIRYVKILGRDDVESHVIEQTGLSILQLILLSLAVKGHFLNNYTYNLRQSYAELGINNEASFLFLNKLTININALKKHYVENQTYDEKWMYSWNPLELHPLISLSETHPEVVYCPFPELFHKRLTEGIYFDIVNSPRFSESFGPSFQKYVGEVLDVVFNQPIFEIIPESEYMDGKKIKHGIDWIVSDSSANIFIECKTKRLKLDAKINIEGDVLKKELEIMAEAIVQTYKNINDAIKGKSNWHTNDLPIFPCIITLEDWFIFSPTTQELLNVEIKSKLNAIGINPDVLESMPYTLTSINTFETVSQIIAQVGIFDFMRVKTLPEYRQWDLNGFINVKYPDYKKVKMLFESDWETLRQEVASLNPKVKVEPRAV